MPSPKPLKSYDAKQRNAYTKAYRAAYNSKSLSGGSKAHEAGKAAAAKAKQ